MRKRHDAQEDAFCTLARGAGGSCLAAFIILLASCGGGGNGSSTPTQDTTSVDLIGEFTFMTEGSWFMLCSNGHRYRVAGPALPDLELRHGAVARSGTPVKTWISGWLGTAVATAGLPPDSFVFVNRVLHMEADQHCAPIPQQGYQGRYEVELPGTDGRTRHIIIDLFSNGDALLTIDLHDGGAALEEDGTWGINSRDQVEAIWTSRDQHQHFRFANERLVSDPGPFAPTTIILDRTTTEPPRMGGTYGEVAQLVRDAGGQLPMDGPDRTSPLGTFFPDTAGRSAFIDLVRQRAPIRSDAALRELEGVSTFGDVVRVIRFERRRRS